MEEPMTEKLLGPDLERIWRELAAQIDQLYDVDRSWNKGFGSWEYEYKYRRGGKTLCTFYFKQGVVNLLIVLGKAEREKYESQRESFSAGIQHLYDDTQAYHDGKWLWIPLDDQTFFEDILSILKMKRRPNRKG